MTASSLTTSCTLARPIYKRRPLCMCPRMRSGDFKDQENPKNIVDANLSILKQRIELVKKKEKLEACGSALTKGWNYQSVYIPRSTRYHTIREFIQLMGFISGSFGLVFICGSLCICLFALLIHLS